MISADQSQTIQEAAYKSGEWHYTQGGAKGGKEPPVDLAKRYGDCTDFTWNATKVALGSAWPFSYDRDKPGTSTFLSGDAHGYTEIESYMARPGDVVVLGGHAGIHEGVVEDAEGETHVLGHANNGRPAKPGVPGHDGTTGVFDFTGNAKVSPHFYRPIIP
jgi:hypothetical protein